MVLARVDLPPRDFCARPLVKYVYTVHGARLGISSEINGSSITRGVIYVVSLSLS